MLQSMLDHDVAAPQDTAQAIDRGARECQSFGRFFRIRVDQDKSARLRVLELLAAGIYVPMAWLLRHSKSGFMAALPALCFKCFKVLSAVALASHERSKVHLSGAREVPETWCPWCKVPTKEINEKGAASHYESKFHRAMIAVRQFNRLAVPKMTNYMEPGYVEGCLKDLPIPVARYDSVFHFRDTLDEAHAAENIAALVAAQKNRWKDLPIRFEVKSSMNWKCPTHQTLVGTTIVVPGEEQRKLDLSVRDEVEIAVAGGFAQDDARTYDRLESFRPRKDKFSVTNIESREGSWLLTVRFFGAPLTDEKIAEYVPKQPLYEKQKYYELRRIVSLDEFRKGRRTTQSLVDMYCEASKGEKCYSKLYLIYRLLGKVERLSQDGKSDRAYREKVLAAEPIPCEGATDVNIARYLEELKLLLDNSQMLALKGALNNRMYLVHGPPGTGKTRVLVAIIQLPVRLCERKVVVSTHSNAALLVILQRLRDLEPTSDLAPLPVALYSSRTSQMHCTRQAQYEAVADVDLMALAVKKTDCPLMRQQYSMWRESLLDRPESKAFEGKLYGLIDKVLSEMLFCTTSSTYSNFMRRAIKSGRFTTLVLDESGQINELGTVMAATAGNLEQIIAAGDHWQLRPYCSSPEMVSASFGRSTFKRLLTMRDATVPTSMLQTCYRSEPRIVQLFSRMFYHDRVRASEHWKTTAAIFVPAAWMRREVAPGTADPVMQLPALMFDNVDASAEKKEDSRSSAHAGQARSDFA